MEESGLFQLIPDYSGIIHCLLRRETDFLRRKYPVSSKIKIVNHEEWLTPYS